MAGPIETMLRAQVTPQMSWFLYEGGAHGFTIDRIDAAGVAIRCGEPASTRLIPWSCLEGVPALLHDRGWVAADKTLADYLEPEALGDVASEVAGLLSLVRVVEIQDGDPVRVRLHGAYRAEEPPRFTSDVTRAGERDQ